MDPNMTFLRDITPYLPVFGQCKDGRSAVEDGVEVCLEVVLVAEVPREDGLVEAGQAEGALHGRPGEGDHTHRTSATAVM